MLAAFSGAALLFGVEPLFVKMALPAFGGAPAVWNVAFAFFTLMLLAGYLYAHALARLPLRRQLAIHGIALLAAAIVLPPRAGPSVPLPASVPPPLALFVLLFVRIGLPFFVLSATAPLVQSWYASGSRNRDPYWLYAASNAGSILALLAYPFLVEPFTGLALQSRIWTAIYAAFAVLTIVCGLVARTGVTRPSGGTPGLSARTPLPNALRVRVAWVALAAVPTMLMLGLTSVLTSEVASVPFVWTLPLTLYLLAYVAAFSRFPWQRLLPFAPYAVLPVVVLWTVHETLTAIAYLTLSALAFLLLALGVVGRLAESRPPAEHLTGFYLWIALGGALGSAFAALVAPLAFAGIAEYPLAIVLSALLVPTREHQAFRSPRLWLAEAGVALGLVATTGLLTHYAQLAQRSPSASVLLWVSLAAGTCAAFFRRPIRFGLCIAALLLYGLLLPDPGGFVVARERNFFGTKRVILDLSGRYRVLISGGTYHGIQAVDPAKATEPLAYYTRSGPLGDVFAAAAARFAGRNVAVVGLGIGAAGCFASPGQAWSFYEIDPAVVQLARDPRLFTALRSCVPGARIVVGDARLSLQQESPRSYALIVLDAYDSDQIPVHLLTREALAAYLAQLAPDGVLAFHISNRHFDLAPVLAGVAADAGLIALERDDETLSVRELQSGKMASSWVVMTRRGAMPAGLTTDARWHDLTRADVPLWTDDYSSLARIVR